MPLTLREGGFPLRKISQALKKKVSASPKLSPTEQWCRYWRSIVYQYYKYARIKNELKETVWKEHFFNATDHCSPMCHVSQLTLK